MKAHNPGKVRVIFLMLYNPRRQNRSHTLCLLHRPLHIHKRIKSLPFTFVWGCVDKLQSLTNVHRTLAFRATYLVVLINMKKLIKRIACNHLVATGPLVKHSGRDKASGAPHFVKLKLGVSKGKISENTVTQQFLFLASVELHGDYKTATKLGQYE